MPAAIAEVDAAHAAALAHGDNCHSRKVGSIGEQNGIPPLQDLNKVWWEMTNLSRGCYDNLFARGDVKR